MQIYEKTAALTLDQGAGVVLRTANGQVRARYALLAGNCTLPAFGPQLAPSIAARIMPVGTYIVATKPLDPALVQTLIPSGAAACDNNVVLDYFRFSQDARQIHRRPGHAPAPVHSRHGCYGRISRKWALLRRD